MSSERALNRVRRAHKRRRSIESARAHKRRRSIESARVHTRESGSHTGARPDLPCPVLPRGEKYFPHQLTEAKLSRNGGLSLPLGLGLCLCLLFLLRQRTALALRGKIALQEKHCSRTPPQEKGEQPSRAASSTQHTRDPHHTSSLGEHDS